MKTLINKLTEISEEIEFIKFKIRCELIKFKNECLRRENQKKKIRKVNIRWNNYRKSILL